VLPHAARLAPIVDRGAGQQIVGGGAQQTWNGLTPRCRTSRLPAALPFVVSLCSLDRIHPRFPLFSF
jgi:hypothetical protein